MLTQCGCMQPCPFYRPLIQWIMHHITLLVMQNLWLTAVFFTMWWFVHHCFYTDNTGITIKKPELLGKPSYLLCLSALLGSNTDPPIFRSLPHTKFLLIWQRKKEYFSVTHAGENGQIYVKDVLIETCSCSFWNIPIYIQISVHFNVIIWVVCVFFFNSVWLLSCQELLSNQNLSLYCFLVKKSDVTPSRTWINSFVVALNGEVFIVLSDEMINILLQERHFWRFYSKY